MLRLLICLVAASFAVPVLAAEPARSTLVDSIHYNLPTHTVDPERGALLGLAECEALLERTADVTFTFALNVDPSEKNGSVRRLADVWIYDLDPAHRSIACDTSACIPLDREVSTNGNDVEVAIDPQTLLQGEACSKDRDIFVRIDLVEDLEEDDDITSAEARVRLDVTGPQPPVIDAVQATDNFIEVKFSEVLDESDAEKWHVAWGTADSVAAGPAELTRLGAVTDIARILSFDGIELPVDRLIHVYVYSEDEAGNLGPLSEPALVEPEVAADYWETHGARNQAACSSAAGDAAWLPLWLILLLLATRRRRHVQVAAVVMYLFLPFTAHAQDGVVELRVGTYTPSVANTPEFSRHFGDHLRWMVGMDGGWFFAHTRPVVVGIDAGIAYSAFTGSAFTGSGRAFEDGSTLTVVPMRLGVRTQSGPWSRWLVLGVRGGLTPHYFRFGNASGVSVADDGAVGRGVLWGWYSSAQLALDLGGGDRESAAKLRAHWSVLRTLLFVEFVYADVDDFGQSSLQLGDAQLNLGLGFAF